MKIRTLKCFEKFKCIASKCEDTCCKGWEIIIDRDTYDKYRKVNSDFGKKLNSKITLYEDNEPGFKLEENDNCPFLNKDKLCDIYTNLGEESLCFTCKMFPRVAEEYGSLREFTLSLACMESARLLLSETDSLEFTTRQSDEVVSSYNSLSFDLYVQIINSRNLALKIIKDREISLNDRIYIFLNFARDIQNCIDKTEISNIENIRKRYKDKDYLKQFIKGIKVSKDDMKLSYIQNTRYDLISRYIKVFNDLETINDDWTNLISKVKLSFFNEDNSSNKKKYIETYEEFSTYYNKYNHEYENIMVYLIFRYFMKSLYDCDVINKAKFCIFSILIIIELDAAYWMENNKKLCFEDQVNIVHLYSKEVEHSENNMQKLYDMFENNDIFADDKLLLLL